MAKKETPDFQSAYLPVDITSLIREHSEGEQSGQTSNIEKLDDVFRWMPGTLNAFYGWANDGKGTFYDFLAVMRAKFDGAKFCMMKQEDISSTKYKNEKPRITANRIHRGLVWTLTGKTPNQKFAERYKIDQIPQKEFVEALEWVDEHFFVVHPKDRRPEAVMGLFQFMYEKKKINHFLIDPFKSLKIETQENKRSDHQLDDLFIEMKEFAVATNTTFDIIAHPKSLTDVREGKGTDSPFKVVTQFMIAGGAAWDNNMDAQYSIYRPERHLNPRDPKVEFHNLKQRNAEEVLAGRGLCRNIEFDPKTRRYYFEGLCPLDGSMKNTKWTQPSTQTIDFSEPKKAQKMDLPEDTPF